MCLTAGVLFGVGAENDFKKGWGASFPLFNRYMVFWIFGLVTIIMIILAFMLPERVVYIDTIPCTLFLLATTVKRSTVKCMHYSKLITVKYIYIIYILFTVKCSDIFASRFYSLL